MKKLILLLVISISTALEVSAQNIVLKDGLYYSENGNLFSGTYTTLFEKGNRKSTLDIVEGKVSGAATYYYENGNIMEIGDQPKLLPGLYKNEFEFLSGVIADKK